MNDHIKELIAMGYSPEEAKRVYDEMGVDPSIQQAADQRAYDTAETAFGTGVANDLRFLNVDPYITETYGEADRGEVMDNAQFDPQHGTAVPYTVNPEYDGFVPGGGETEEYLGMPTGGYEGGNMYAPEAPQDPEQLEKSNYQRELLQARMDASGRIGDEVGRDSFQYEDFQPMSTGNRVFQSMLTYGLTYLANGGDVEGALSASMDFNNTRNDREHRYGQIQYLESRGYNPQDINEWVRSGDPKSLVKNKKSWQNAGGGALWRENEKGEVEWRQAPGAGQEKPMTEYQRQSLELQRQRESRLGSGGTGGDGRPSIRKPQAEYDAQGRYLGTRDLETGEFHPARGTEGGYKTPAEAAKAEERRKELEGQQTSVGNFRSTLDTLRSFSEEDTGPFVNITGSVGKAGYGSDLLTKEQANKFSGGRVGTERTRQAYTTATEFNSKLQNMGIAEAKAMGASGINTEAEANRFAKSMPQIDFSSHASYLASLDKIEKYVDDWNKKAGGTSAPRSSSASGPAIGTVKAGYVFVGGNPNDRNSWVPQR